MTRRIGAAAMAAALLFAVPAFANQASYYGERFHGLIPPTSQVRP